MNHYVNILMILILGLIIGLVIGLIIGLILGALILRLMLVHLNRMELKLHSNTMVKLLQLYQKVSQNSSIAWMQKMLR